MRIADHSDHSLNFHNQSDNRNVIYSVETFHNEDCLPTTLTGNIYIQYKILYWMENIGQIQCFIILL